MQLQETISTLHLLIFSRVHSLKEIMKRKGGTELAGQQKTIEKNVSRVIAISSSHSGKHFVQPYQRERGKIFVISTKKMPEIQFWKHIDVVW